MTRTTQIKQPSGTPLGGVVGAICFAVVTVLVSPHLRAQEESTPAAVESDTEVPPENESAAEDSAEHVSVKSADSVSEQPTQAEESDGPTNVGVAAQRDGWQEIPNSPKNTAKPANSGASSDKRMPSMAAIKTSALLPLAAGDQFDPSGTASFELRYDGGAAFLLLGVGLIIPSGGDAIKTGGVHAELGAGRYLGDSGDGFYVAAAVSPRAMGVSSPASRRKDDYSIYYDDPAEPGTVVRRDYDYNTDPNDAEFAVHMVFLGRIGCVLMRSENRTFFTELTVGQNVLPVPVPRRFETESIYPTEVSLGVGIGL